ncbi:MAG: FtsX-like permease family protein [Lachnospiraceae bacterium]|nr:FtsX-like permease family protein [Lachnospiraceae bacterium]
MTLNKRYKRNIKANLSFYISASVLTMVALLMFYLFYVAGTGINDYGNTFFDYNKVEDAVFTTYLEIPDEDIPVLEKDYNLLLEKEHFVNCDETDYTARIFTANEKVDLYELIDGRDITARDEIIISAGYAQNNGISIGDTLSLHAKDYTVVGLFLRPDYLYMLENLTDDYMNVSTFFLAYMDEAEFEECFGTGTLNYKVIYHDETAVEDFRLNIHDQFFMASYLSADDNVRISFVNEQADMFILSAWVMLVILPFITVALISILIGRKIKSEQKLIGTLSALGYKKSALMWHYSLFALIPGILGGCLTAIASLLLVQPFGEMGLADYEPMQATFHLPVSIAVAGILIPTLIYFVCAMLRVRKLLRKDTVELLNGNVGNTGKSHRMLSRRHMKVKYKMALRSFAGNPGRTFVIFLGIFLGAMIVAFGYIFIDSVNAVGSDAHAEFGTFQYEYVLNALHTGTPEDGEAMMVLPYEDSNAVRFSMLGLDADNTLWNLTTTDGERADLENGWYMSTLCAAIFDLEPGDTFTFRSISTLEEYTVTIDGVIKNGYQSYILSSRENMSKFTELDSKTYNAVLASHALDIDSREITELISDTTYENQMENLLTSMAGVIDALIIIGAVICIASLYATINMMISENRTNISMLKVLGYENRRINSMIINSNHLLLLPGIVTGIVAAYLIMVWYCVEFVEVERIMIPATMKPKSILLTTVITAACYFVSLFLLRGKVERTDMIESLKDNRE